jgi:hypothetical protein
MNEFRIVYIYYIPYAVPSQSHTRRKFSEFRINVHMYNSCNLSEESAGGSQSTELMTTATATRRKTRSMMAHM